MNVHTIQQHALSLWLKGARLPLTVAENVVKRGEDTANWPPSIAFEKVEASVKGTLGRITGDDHLVGLANLQRTEVEKRVEALEKQTEAEVRRAAASREEARTRQELDEQREVAAETAAQRKQRLAAEKRQARREVEDRAGRRKTATRKAAAAHDEVTDRKARRAEQDRLAAEADALEVEARAVEAEGELLALDDAVEAKKAARRAR